MTLLRSWLLVPIFSVGALACMSGCLSEVDEGGKAPATKDVSRGGSPAASAEAEDSTPTPETPCVAATCEQIGVPGPQPDGCGGTLQCAPPPGACVPKTCEGLGKTSGTAPDGCGKTLDCNAASCADAKAGNSSKNSAADLGAMTDSPNSKRVVADLKLADTEEDWFKFKVTDGGFGGNPRIDASVSLATAEVAIYYVCDSQPDYSTCADGGTADATVGKGCRAVGKVALSTECSGISENGTAFVRVKKTAADTQCRQYTLTVTVE